jgi:hypothetical protein
VSGAPVLHVPAPEIAIAVEMRARDRQRWDVIAERMGYCPQVLRREVRRAGYSTDRLRAASRLSRLDRAVYGAIAFRVLNGRRPPTRTALAQELGCSLGEAGYAVRKMDRLGLLTRVAGRLDINLDVIGGWQ